MERLTAEQRDCLTAYEPDASWACVVGMLVVIRPGRQQAEIIDGFGRYRTPRWHMQSELTTAGDLTDGRLLHR